MTKQTVSNLFWVTMWSFSGLDGNLKGDMSLIKSWKGHGVAREMHQNATKMVTIALQHIEVTNFSSVVWASTLVHFGLFWCFFAHLMCDPTIPCTESYSLLSVQEIKKKITLVSQDKFETYNGDQLTILVHFGPFWFTSCVTSRHLNDLIWLISPFKCRTFAEKDYISHSGRI